MAMSEERSPQFEDDSPQLEEDDKYETANSEETKSISQVSLSEQNMMDINEKIAEIRSDFNRFVINNGTTLAALHLEIREIRQKLEKKEEKKKENHPNYQQFGQCNSCGRMDHQRSACKLRWAFCHKCNKRGHIAKACHKKRTRKNKLPQCWPSPEQACARRQSI
jgi:hypothetical protein